MCKCPVGEGAKRVRAGPSGSFGVRVGAAWTFKDNEKDRCCPEARGVKVLRR